MKKVLIIAAVAGLLVVLFDSCKTHEKCPAYTKVNSPQTEGLVKS